MSENNTNQSKVHGWAEWPGWPYVLVGLAVILRLAHIYNSRTNPTFWAPAVDPAWYDEAAFNILRGQWGPFPLFRAPLYPALLAGMYGIFGHDLAAARILNVAVQGAAIWALWRVGRSYFAPAVGILAAALLAINGTAIYFAGEILSTSTELLAAVLGLWATLRLTRDVRPTAVFLCGLSWGLAAITRPNFLVCFPVVLAAIWFVQYRQLSATSRRLPTLALSFLVWFVAAFVPILPVTAANAIKGGEFVLIATQGGVNFWIGNNPESTGILSVLPGYGNTWTMEDAEFEAEHEAGRMLRPGELSSFYFTKGWKFLSAHPGLSIRFMIRKSLLFFNRFEISNNKHILYFAAKSPWLPPLLWLNMGILVPLAALGIWVGRRTFSVQLLAGLILLFMISVILFFVTARFRMPVVPWLSLVAASGLWWAWQRIAVRARAREFLPLLLLVPGIALAHMNLWNLTEAPLGWARYMEGNAYLQLDRLDSARAAFLDAYHDGQALSRTQLNLGVIAYRQGNYSEARRWYEGALDADPTSVNAWNNLGTTAETEGDSTRAIECYERALSIRPTAPDPRHNLAGIHFRLGVAALRAGSDSTAIRHLTRCLSLLPTAITHYDLAIALGRTGEPERALAHLDSALALDPLLAPARQLREQLRGQ